MKHKKGFDLPTMRRLEIERYARHLAVADTDDFRNFLVAWQWHNPDSKDAAGALMIAAKRMGGAITEEQAEQVINEADVVPKCRKADALGRYLRLSDEMRASLGICTIGSFDMSKRQRSLRRKERNRACKEMKRRAVGKKSRAEYLAGAKSRTPPWKDKGISRRTWYRRQKAKKQVRVHATLPSTPDAMASSSTLCRQALARPYSLQPIQWHKSGAALVKTSVPALVPRGDIRGSVPAPVPRKRSRANGG